MIYNRLINNAKKIKVRWDDDDNNINSYNNT